MTLEGKHALIKYPSADVEEDRYHTEEDDSHAETEEFSNIFSYCLKRGAPLSIVKKDC